VLYTPIEGGFEIGDFWMQCGASCGPRLLGPYPCLPLDRHKLSPLLQPRLSPGPWKGGGDTSTMVKVPIYIGHICWANISFSRAGCVCAPSFLGHASVSYSQKHNSSPRTPIQVIFGSLESPWCALHTIEGGFEIGDFLDATCGRHAAHGSWGHTHACH
jgi:hypothetical protein